MRKLTLLLVTVITSAVCARAQTPEDLPYERFLVPIYIDPSSPLPGAHNSVWATSLIARNEAETPVKVTGLPTGICIGTCQTFPVKTTFTPSLSQVDPNRGAFLYVTRGAGDRVTFV